MANILGQSWWAGAILGLTAARDGKGGVVWNQISERAVHKHV